MHEGLVAEVARFREYADTCSGDGPSGDWEVDYPDWESLRAAVTDFVDRCPFDQWSADAVAAVLYAIARDNECELLTDEIRERAPSVLIDLAAAALATAAEADAKWQLADQLGRLPPDTPPDLALLLQLAGDRAEYVRRRALISLARMNVAEMETIAASEWDRDEDVHSRINVLWCLWRIGSPRLPRYLEAVAEDGREYLVAYVAKVRAGQVTE